MMPPERHTTIRDGLALFFTTGPALVEIRILKTPQRTVSGYFDSLDGATAAVEAAAATLNGGAQFYATLNPVTRDAHARAANRLKGFADVTTSDKDILRRRYFLIDVDPVRPVGVSSTDAELADALQTRDRIVAWLGAQGWPAPIRAMSGNGGHADYAIDLPNDDPSRDLLKGCLEALHQHFHTPTVTIDRSVYNAARISKIYGTVARKGDPTTDRPHRLAAIEDRPTLTVVTRAQLEALAAHHQPVPPSAPRRETPAQPSHGTTRSYRPSPRLDMRAEFDARGWYLRELRPGWHAVRCPWIDTHSGLSGDSETAIREPDDAEGLWGFKCQHEHCTGRTIRDVWELFKPADDGHVSPTDPASPIDDDADPADTTAGAPPDPAPWVERFPAFCLRLRDRVLPPDVVPGLIPSVGLVMAHGQPRSLKTWVAQELARATSTGTAAFGLARFAVPAPRQTWYVTEEDPEVEIRNRFTCLYAGTQTSEPEALHVSVQKAIAIDDPAWQRRMITYAQDAQIAFTIIDPVRSSSEAVDQGPRELKPLAAFLRTFMRETGSALLLIHHDVKPLAGKSDDRARPQRASGGGIFSIADAPIHTELIGASQTMLTPAFYKFAIAPAPCLVTLSADDPKRPTWVRLTGEDTTATTATELVLLAKIRDYLRDHPGTSGSKVATGIHANKAQTLAALELLFAAGEADCYQRGQARLWSLIAKRGAA
jgi:hypothetical protein